MLTRYSSPANFIGSVSERKTAWDGDAARRCLWWKKRAVAVKAKSAWVQLVCDKFTPQPIKLACEVGVNYNETSLPPFFFFFFLAPSLLTYFPWVHFRCSRCVSFWLPAHQTHFSPPAVFAHSLHACVCLCSQTWTLKPRTQLRVGRACRREVLFLDYFCSEFSLNYWCADPGANTISANQTGRGLAGTSPAVPLPLNTHRQHCACPSTYITRNEQGSEHSRGSEKPSRGNLAWCRMQYVYIWHMEEVWDY